MATDCVGRDGLEPVIVQVEQHHLRLCSLQNQVTKLLHLQKNNTAVIQTHLLCIEVSSFLPTSPSQLQRKSDIRQKVQIQISHTHTHKKSVLYYLQQKPLGMHKPLLTDQQYHPHLPIKVDFYACKQENLKHTKKEKNTIC